jgi:hypothetical protein
MWFVRFFLLLFLLFCDPSLTGCAYVFLRPFRKPVGSAAFFFLDAESIAIAIVIGVSEAFILIICARPFLPLTRR